MPSNRFLIKSATRVVALISMIVPALAVGASSASAEVLSPWWGLTSTALPTNIHAGIARDEVQSLTVNATGGDVVLFEPRRLLEVENGRRGFGELLIAVVPHDATVGVMQEKLDGIFPSRKLKVTEGSAVEENTSSYVITFPGQSVEPIVANGAAAGFFGGEPLSGGRAEANVIETAQGRPDGVVEVIAENLGDANTAGAVKITDELPKGLEAVAIHEGGEIELHPTNCVLNTLTCTFEGQTVPPYRELEAKVSVVVSPGASTGEENNTVTVSGGGANGARTITHPVDIGGEEKFGIDNYEFRPENLNGSLDTQASSHPFQLTTIIAQNRMLDQEGFPRTPGGLTKDVVAELPAGFVGNPTPFAQCTDKQFGLQRPGLQITNSCSPQTAIGVADVEVMLGEKTRFGGGIFRYTQPIFNMVPRHGEPARFAFKVAGIYPVFLDASIRTGRDYGVTVSSNNIVQTAWFLGVKLTFWGVPGDPRHDAQRGWDCVNEVGACPPSGSLNPPPFLVMPASCETPFHSTLHEDTWGLPSVASVDAIPVSYTLPEALVGCNHLPFAPVISASVDVPAASTPSGLTVDVHIPQEAALNPEGLGESTLKDTTVSLPEGVALNPGGADGLETCSEDQIGFLPGESEGADLRFTPDMPSCPDGSKIATVKIKTPLLPNGLEGAVFLATQDANPFGSLIAMYVVAQDPVSGVLVKIPGKVEPDPVTGRLVSTFKKNPDLPFEDLELHFFGGARAPLATPPFCGAYTTSALFAPWSGEEPVNATSTFQILTGPNGSGCQSPLPFSPSLTAGATSIQAGGFSPFTMTMSRPDGSQNLQAIKLRMPPGLLGTLATVKLCKEAQANAGTCGPESLIGHTIVSVGVGGNPYSVTGGQVFITEGYKGAPYGLSIVNPAKAGPFDLGKVVVRAKIELDPHTAVLTITTDTTGPYKIPTILDGIPLQIQHVNVAIDRPGFTFNPTNCSPLSIAGALTSDQGAVSNLNVPFQVTNCAILKFEPKFTVSTSGKTSKANGASLTAKLSYPKTAQGTQANITRVKVDLPKQLPSRLTTLQKACTNAQFELNPANCPSASKIGYATVTTPLLPVPLQGPAIFVSHGGEAFPSLTMVLQGYGVTIDLVGTTFISKKGITSTTFKTVPDTPFNTFELKLPQGKFSALGANTNLCKSKLAMPTEFVAQNGLKINETTKVAVTGCKKAKKATKHKKKHGKKGNGKRKK
jgi:hypothetical protein